jgi:hypothetical protein
MPEGFALVVWVAGVDCASGSCAVGSGIDGVGDGGGCVAERTSHGCPVSGFRDGFDAPDGACAVEVCSWRRWI